MSTPGTQPNQSFSTLFKLFLEEQQNNPEDCWLAIVDPPHVDELIRTEFTGWVKVRLEYWLSNTDICADFKVEEILSSIEQTKGDSQNVG